MNLTFHYYFIGIRTFGKNFTAIAEVIGTKTESHVRSFYVNYRRRYNLDTALKVRLWKNHWKGGQIEKILWNDILKYPKDYFQTHIIYFIYSPKYRAYQSFFCLLHITQRELS